MKNKIKIGIFSILCSAFVMTSCETYPGYDDYVNEQLVAITSYDTNFNFTQPKTFSISDTVAIVENGTVTKVLISDPKYPKLPALVNKIKDNMNKMTKEGYTYSTTNPDLGIMISLIQKDNVIVTNPWWWDAYCYWDYWACGYYPYYPYPYPVVVGGYTVGTVVMDMFNLKGNENKRVTAVWTGVVRGLYTGNHTDAQVDSAIDDCFVQTVPFQK